MPADGGSLPWRRQGPALLVAGEERGVFGLEFEIPETSLRLTVALAVIGVIPAVGYRLR